MGRQLTNAARAATEDDTDAGRPAPRARPGRDPHSRLPHPRGRGTQAAAGSAVVRVPLSPHLTAPDGGLLPGAFAVLADACCGCAIAAALPAGGAALTAQLRVEFIRPLPAGQAWIEGRAEADAVDDRQRAGPRRDRGRGGPAARRGLAAHDQGIAPGVPRRPRQPPRPEPSHAPCRLSPCRLSPGLRAAWRPVQLQAPTPAGPAPRRGQQAGGLRPVGLDVPPAAWRREQLRDGARGSARAAGP